MSYGIGCGSNTPSVNSRITSYLPWILKKTKGESFCRKWCKKEEINCLPIDWLIYREWNWLMASFERVGEIWEFEMEKPRKKKFLLQGTFQSNFSFSLINCQHSPATHTFTHFPFFYILHFILIFFIFKTIFWLSHLFSMNWHKLERIEPSVAMNIESISSYARWVI